MENIKCRAGNARHLSPSLNISFTIQSVNLNYHVCRTYCQKISLIQRWTNSQLQSEKRSLVGVRKSQWLFLSFFSQCFVTVFPHKWVSLLHFNLTPLHLNKWDKISLLIWAFTPHRKCDTLYPVHICTNNKRKRNYN